MRIPGPLPRQHTSQTEPETTARSDASMLELITLQRMRQILAFSEVSMFRSRHNTAREQAVASEARLDKHIADVNLMRTRTIERYKSFPLTKNYLLSWSQTERDWLAGVERMRHQWQEDVKFTRESEKLLISAIARRRLIESRLFKYEEIVNILANES